MSSDTQQRKLAAVMFTDRVGYSALSQRNEALALELLEEHRRAEHERGQGRPDGAGNHDGAQPRQRCRCGGR